jgi:hypothetical protein
MVGLLTGEGSEKIESGHDDDDYIKKYKKGSHRIIFFTSFS